MDRELISRIDARRSKEVLSQHGYDGELLQLLRDCKAALSKDADPVESSLSVEEFIAGHTIKIEIFHEPTIVCKPDDLRTWMAGHARVEMLLIQMAIRDIEKLQTFAPVEQRIFTNGTIKLLENLLAASKDQRNE